MLALFLSLAFAAAPPPPRVDEQALGAAAKKAHAHGVESELSPELCAITRDWAEKMASRYALSTNPTGHDGFKERAARAMEMTHGAAASEILAATYGFEKSIEEHANSCVQGWLESPSHRREFNVRHKHYCLSMAPGKDGKYYCAGIFTD